MENSAKNTLTIEEQFAVYNKDLYELFDSYENNNGSKDSLEICMLHSSKKFIDRLVAEIICLKIELKTLPIKKPSTICGECRYWLATGHCSLSNKHKTYGGFCDEGIKKMVDKNEK